MVRSLPGVDRAARALSAFCTRPSFPQIPAAFRQSLPARTACLGAGALASNFAGIASARPAPYPPN